MSGHEARPGRRQALRWTLVLAGRFAADVPLLGLLIWLAIPREGTGGRSALLANAALFAAFGLVHSLLARPFAKRALARICGETAVRLVFVVVAGASLVTVFHLWQQPGGVVWRTGGALYVGLTCLYVLSVVGLVRAASAFDYMEFLGVRPIVRALEGRTSRPAVFSARGLYAHCRHPQYAILLVTLWTAPVMTVGRLEFAALASIYLLVGTFLEERNLRVELGEEYDLYRENVPMWIPRLHPWQPPPLV